MAIPAALLAAAPYLATLGAGVAGGYAGQKLAGGGSGAQTGPNKNISQLPLRTPQQQQAQQLLLQLGLAGLRNQPQQAFIPPQSVLEQLGRTTGGAASQPPQFNIPQTQISRLLEQVLGNTNQFENIAQNEVRRFHRDLIPTISEKFSSMGSGGSQRSSGFQNAIGSAASDLSSRLAALGANFGQQQQGLNQNLLSNLLGYGQGQQRLGIAQQATNTDLLRTLLSGGLQERSQGLSGIQALLGMGLASPFENIYQPPQPSFMQSLAPGIGAGLGQGASYALGKYIFR